VAAPTRVADAAATAALPEARFNAASALLSPLTMAGAAMPPVTPVKGHDGVSDEATVSCAGAAEGVEASEHLRHRNAEFSRSFATRIGTCFCAPPSP
jgi:hypothetical protein